MFLKCWGTKVTVGDLTLAKQKTFADWCIEQGFSLAYAARNFTVLKAALNHARVMPPDAIVCAESKMQEVWGLIGKAPRRVMVPSDTELVAMRTKRTEYPGVFRASSIIGSPGGRR